MSSVSKSLRNIAILIATPILIKGKPKPLMSYIGKVFCENEVLEVFQQGIHLKLPRRCEIFRKVYTKLPVKMKIRNLNLKPI